MPSASKDIVIEITDGSSNLNIWNNIPPCIAEQKNSRLSVDNLKLGVLVQKLLIGPLHLANTIEATERKKRRQVTWRLLISDFANMLKAFMGANYLTVAYAFTKTGLVPGILCLLLIASVTDHCCHLIVKCKYHGIDHLIKKQKSKYSNGSSGEIDENSDNEENDESRRIREKMVRSLTYGDVGKIAYGAKGLLLVNTCILFTQFGFCVSYFIFVGNTIYSMFPFSNTSVSVGNTSEAVPIFPAASTVAPNLSAVRDAVLGNSNLTQAVNYSYTKLTEAWTMALDNVLPSTIPYTNISDFVEKTSAPDLRLLVISPLPIFMGFAFLRSVRAMGFVSVAADVSIFIGCVVTMIYLMIGFTPSSTWNLTTWSTLPIFFGMVTSSFEGIGTIIPIESSMEGNRHNFSKFLHGAVGTLAVVLLLFGIMGYLRYGEGTQQMLNANIPHGTTIGTAINICLSIGVILTFPLQMYPVIELLEIYIFSDGRICGPKKSRVSRRSEDDYDDEDDDDDDHDESDVNSGEFDVQTDKDLLLPKNDSEMPAAVAAVISDKVPTWKRNVLRILTVLAAGGLAVLLRDLYAYVGAFVGALGSSLLAYIIPCWFHLKLSKHVSSKGVKIKDCIIIIFGIGASLVSLYMTIIEVVKAS